MTTHFKDLKPGVYRARWLNARETRNAEGSVGFVMHKFNLVGVGEVEIPDPYINPAGPIINTTCMDQLSIHVLPPNSIFKFWNAELKVVTKVPSL